MSCEIDKSDRQASNRTDVKLDLPEGVPPLTSLYMYISGSCNLACRHCWITPTYQNGGNIGKQIGIELVRKAIREGKPLGLRMVKLTGGEPMLNPQFRELVDLLDGDGLQIHIETNGTLIDHDLAKFLKQREHISFISVSLDGADDKTHEDLRGAPRSFAQAITGIRNLVEQGFRPQIICTLHKGNVSQIDDVVKFAENLGCGSIKFNHVQQVGRGEHFPNELVLGIVEIISLYNHIERVLKKENEIPIHFDIPIAFFSIKKLLDDCLGRCTVRNILGLLAGGELSLCGMGVTKSELIYGQIKRDSLRDVWCNSPGLIQLRAQVPAEMEGICAQCIHRDLCLGTCVADNFRMTGRLNAPYHFCQIADDLGLFPESRKKITNMSKHK